MANLEFTESGQFYATRKFQFLETFLLANLIDIIHTNKIDLKSRRKRYFRFEMTTRMVIGRFRTKQIFCTSTVSSFVYVNRISTYPTC